MPEVLSGIPDAAARALVASLRGIPMHQWPPEAFADLGLRNPYAPGNLTLRIEALEATRGLGGCVVECGVFRGYGLAPIATWLEQEDDPRRIVGFDSFEGFPDAEHAQDAIAGEIPDFSRPAYFAGTSVDAVRNYLRRFGVDERVDLVPGFFSETIPKTPTGPVSLLILDRDLYRSYLDCLENLYDRVVPGGWIVFDEYFSKKYPGARVTIDEFFATRPEKPRLAQHLLKDHPFERWYVVKAA